MPSVVNASDRCRCLTMTRFGSVRWRPPCGSWSSATNPRSPRRRSQPRRLSRTRLEVEKSKSQKVEKSKGPSPARGSVGIRFRDSGSGSGRDSVRDGYRDGGRHRHGAGRTRGMTPFLPLRWCRGGSRRPACGLMGDAAVTANPQAGRLWPPSLASPSPLPLPLSNTHRR